MLSFCAALRTLKPINSTKKEYQSFGLSKESFESVMGGGLEVRVHVIHGFCLIKYVLSRHIESWQFF